MPLVDFNLYLITDRQGLPAGQDLLVQVEAALEGGVRCVQLREKDLPASELLPLARELRRLTGRFQAKLLVNGDLEVARAVAADGVHLGRGSLPVAEVRRILGPGQVIGVSTHSVPEIGAAAAGGADFVTFGPVWFTPSKAPYGEPLGPGALRDACRQASIPVFPLGGVTAERAPELLDAGCPRAACIKTVLHAADPAAAARKFIVRLAGHTSSL